MPMTSASKFPSDLAVRVNGRVAAQVTLPDDPADSRGILSWHAQPRDGHLYEAGSYGELVRVTVPAAAIAESARTGEMIVRLEATEPRAGGLAIYGARFGRYPLDPTLLFVLK